MNLYNLKKEIIWLKDKYIPLYKIEYKKLEIIMERRDVIEKWNKFFIFFFNVKIVSLLGQIL